MMASAPVSDTAPLRRPLKTRQRVWAQTLARLLTRAGVTPNAISLASLVFAIAAGLSLASTARAEGSSRQVLFFTAAACIQLRLLCNMLDGMVAVEGGKRTVYGEISRTSRAGAAENSQEMHIPAACPAAAMR
jgi:hypothetical protein